MYKKGAGNDKQGKDAGNRTLCPYRNFSQAIMYRIGSKNLLLIRAVFKVVHRRQKLTTDFLKLFELTSLVVTISISRKKICLPWIPGGHFLRGLITKS